MTIAMNNAYKFIFTKNDRSDDINDEKLVYPEFLLLMGEPLLILDLEQVMYNVISNELSMLKDIVCQINLRE